VHCDTGVPVCVSGKEHDVSVTRTDVEGSQLKSSSTQNVTTTSPNRKSMPVQLEAFGLDVCRCVSDQQVPRPPTETTSHRSTAARLGVSSTHSQVGQRSSGLGDTRRQTSRDPAVVSDKSSAIRSRRDLAATNSTNSAATRDRVRADDGRTTVGVTTRPTDDRRRTRATGRRHHSLTSLGSGDYVISATPPQAVTSSSQSVLRGDVIATFQHLSTSSPSSSFHSDDVRRQANSTVYPSSDKYIANNDQSHRANCLAPPTVPLPQTTVIDVVRRPVDMSTQTRSVLGLYTTVFKPTDGL